MEKLILKLSAGIFLLGFLVFSPTLARSQVFSKANIPHPNLTADNLAVEDPNESVEVIYSEEVHLQTYSNQTVIISSRKNGAVLVELTNSNLRPAVFDEASASIEPTHPKKKLYRILSADWIFISDFESDHSTLSGVPFKNIKFSDGFECDSTHIFINGVDMCE